MKIDEKKQETFSTDLKSYYRKIEESLVCSHKEKKHFLHDLTERIDEYIVDNSIKTIDEIEQHFGLPEDIADTFLQGVPPIKLKRAMNWTKILVIAIIFLILSFAIYLIASFIDGAYANRGYYEESISEYSEYILE